MTRTRATYADMVLLSTRAELDANANPVRFGPWEVLECRAHPEEPTE